MYVFITCWRWITHDVIVFYTVREKRDRSNFSTAISIYLHLHRYINYFEMSIMSNVYYKPVLKCNSFLLFRIWHISYPTLLRIRLPFECGTPLNPVLFRMRHSTESGTLPNPVLFRLRHSTESGSLSNAALYRIRFSFECDTLLNPVLFRMRHSTESGSPSNPALLRIRLSSESGSPSNPALLWIRLSFESGSPSNPALVRIRLPSEFGIRQMRILPSTVPSGPSAPSLVLGCW